MGKLIIDGIEYSGGGDLGNNSVAFIDTSNVIVPKTTATGSNVFTYTATQNCVLCILMVCSNLATTTGQDYYIDDKWIGRNDWTGSDGGQYSSTYFQLKKGQTFRLDKGAVSYAVYGLVSSSEQNSKLPVTIWENPNPSVDFAGQTVTLNSDLSEYKYYEVQFAHAKNVLNRVYSTGKIPTNCITDLIFALTVIRYRNVTSVTDNSITFGDGINVKTYGSTWETINNYLIPIKIIAYK